ncbi:hypothetical protein [Lysinibacillus sp. ZYM-1]|uniref:hypothetical protein n=1 Tax=Lysinibacillus sp. ZYM-1 TaxID=1681184 RepID=UPI0006CE7733|nr:hypothetical protein [Lysinibacillus sp. ZYM-1]KPN96080.1 hypothetical protein AO843_19035 [Lysinibacillus sp. ZYM-1]
MITKLLTLIKSNVKQIPEKEGCAIIHRYSNDGFTCKPLKSDVHRYGENFIDIVITDFKMRNEKVNEDEIKTTVYMEQKWSGCFLDVDTTHLLDGVLSFRSLDNKNFAYFPKDKLIWVRNISPYLDEKNGPIPFVGFVNKPYYPNGIKFPQEIAAPQIDFVQMPFEKAIERLEIVKREQGGQIEEIYCELYLLKSQLEHLTIIR